MAYTEHILEVSLHGFWFGIVNPELIEAEPEIGQKESCDWECLYLKTDTAKQDLTDLLGPVTLQRIVNIVIESIKQA